VTTGQSLFSLFPPAFAAVPQYLVHITVELLPLTGRVEDWRGTQEPVSSPRHIKRSMQISRTTLTLSTSYEGLCDLSYWQRFQALYRLTP
jgi:hypothetical protein